MIHTDQEVSSTKVRNLKNPVLLHWSFSRGTWVAGLWHQYFKIKKYIYLQEVFFLTKPGSSW